MTTAQQLTHMEETRKWAATAAVLFTLATISAPTVIGPVVFGLLGLGAVIRWQAAKYDERPWWSKSFITLWRERGESDD